MTMTARMITAATLGMVWAATVPAVAADTPADDAGHRRVEQLNQQQLDSLHARTGAPAPAGFLGAPLMTQSVQSTRPDR